MHPERAEVNPRLEMGWNHSCRVTPLAFKNAFSHPFWMLGRRGFCRTSSAMAASASPNCRNNQMGPTCSFSSPPAQILFHLLSKKEKKTHSEGFCHQSLGGSRAVNGCDEPRGCPCSREALPAGPALKHKGFRVGCCRHGGTAQGQDPGRYQSATTLLPPEHIRGTARPSWEPGGFSWGSEGRLCLVLRARQCQMTPAFHYRLLTTPFITAKCFATRRLPTGLPSLPFDIGFGLN